MPQVKYETFAKDLEGKMESYSGYKLFAARMVIYAIHDYKYYTTHTAKTEILQEHYEEIIDSCIRFFTSNAFIVYCHIAGIEIDQDEFLDKLYGGII